jgi:hypothetical protein
MNARTSCFFWGFEVAEGFSASVALSEVSEVSEASVASSKASEASAASSEVFETFVTLCDISRTLHEVFDAFEFQNQISEAFSVVLINPN